MKVDLIKRTESSKELKKAKKDLTSFGVSNHSSKPQMTEFSKAASNAAKNNAMANISFKGHWECKDFYYETDGEGQPTECGWTRGQKSYYKTMSNYGYTIHDADVYIGDPGEKISDEVKREAAFYMAVPAPPPPPVNPNDSSSWGNFMRRITNEPHALDWLDKHEIVGHSGETQNAASAILGALGYRKDLPAAAEKQILLIEASKEGFAENVAKGLRRLR